jgi:hypothetical protein
MPIACRACRRAAHHPSAATASEEALLNKSFLVRYLFVVGCARVLVLLRMQMPPTQWTGSSEGLGS